MREAGDEIDVGGRFRGQVDKLDKEPWECVRAEMIDEKGLDAAAADRYGGATPVLLEDSPLTLEPGWDDCLPPGLSPVTVADGGSHASVPRTGSGSTSS